MTEIKDKLVQNYAQKKVVKTHKIGAIRLYQQNQDESNNVFGANTEITKNI